MSHEEILTSFYRTVWQDGDVEAIDRYFAPGSAAGGILPDMALSVEDMKTLVQAALAIVEEPRITISRTVSDGVWLAALVHIDCLVTQTATRATLHGQVMMRFDDNRIAEAYNHFDVMTFLQQLGALPPNIIELALTGDAA